MLGLKLPTDPRWVNIVETNISEILTDHAYCEQKAATNAINIVIQFPEYPDMVDALLELAREELQHFQQVHKKIVERGYTLGKERRDEYVFELNNFIRKGFTKNIVLVDKLLFSALVEARSCERFKVLSDNINDPDLKQFYRDLMVSEANHYTLFLGFAKKYADGVDVDQRWKEYLDYEAEIISKYGKRETIHG
ncbi:MAG TPA: tRNA-(ms[2]io[6]A)-hydroxylase [Bacteroidia bacterium]|jgi:tRNA-(ms[2]io[6]A)-hydroxylase|nr:tRNA-(ms[2]io[6]A)-hydroxylase [Bacteroidota bacterium]MBP6403790.1 tRNA-(ms[2]io[6]A)-hydroxylase [Bacteroidia bacterium]MBK9524938.1 tRNA-(ms[2]io[6]A)-hydroxylase [Bacteroidota bacterium]MBK9543108.1 tRNA-(ms[2]io[6]A)-hydroxylase [Bacteroidota bacterium]MBL0257737.1 tRNA-(ms[2]io[6]A)-hydroxylase [Bacteroidota bacterium]